MKSSIFSFLLIAFFIPFFSYFFSFFLLSTMHFKRQFLSAYHQPYRKLWIFYTSSFPFTTITTINVVVNTVSTIIITTVIITVAKTVPLTEAQTRMQHENSSSHSWDQNPSVYTPNLNLIWHFWSYPFHHLFFSFFTLSFLSVFALLPSKNFSQPFNSHSSKTGNTLLISIFLHLSPVVSIIIIIVLPKFNRTQKTHGNKTGDKKTKQIKKEKKKRNAAK